MVSYEKTCNDWINSIVFEAEKKKKIPCSCYYMFGCLLFLSISISLWKEMRFIATIFHTMMLAFWKTICELNVIVKCMQWEARANTQNRACINKHTDNQHNNNKKSSEFAIEVCLFFFFFSQPKYWKHS